MDNNNNIIIQKFNESIKRWPHWIYLKKKKLLILSNIYIIEIKKLKRSNINDPFLRDTKYLLIILTFFSPYISKINKYEWKEEEKKTNFILKIKQVVSLIKKKLSNHN